jgi:radical SAM superfamily enzyme YgiQ (UPF0313 family)
MVIKVALIYPNNHVGIISNLEPLGLLYIASYLREKDIDVSFYDFMTINKRKRELKLIEIINSSPEYIGLGCNVANYETTLKYANLIKKYNPEIKIIVGGPLPTSIPEKFLETNHFDAVCIGEGEETFYEYLKKGKQAKGLMIKTEDQYFSTGERERIQDLDLIPFPALDLVDLKKYSFPFQKASPISSIMTSRGCPFHCKFCFHGVSGYKWRSRSPKNVLKELDWQINDLGVKEICIWDDNFTLDLKRTQEICRQIIKQKIKFKWQCSNGIRVDRVDYKTLKLMKYAGCWSVSLAPETGDPYVLQKIQKQFTLQDIERVNQWCKDLNLFAKIFLMIGMPYENRNSAIKTLNLLKKLKPDSFSAHIYTPFPKTDLVEEFNVEPVYNRGYRNLDSNRELNAIFNKMNQIFYLNPKNVINIITKVGIRNTIDAVWHFLKAKFQF